MAYTHKVQSVWSGGGAQQSITVQRSADAEIFMQPSIGHGVTNQLATLAFAIAKAHLIFLLCDENLTIKVNSSSAPTETINLIANEPYIWYSGALFTNLFTHDVTAFYLSNGGSNDATLNIGVLYDSH